MKRMRYYKPTVGSDHIPDRHAWVDRVLPWAIIALALPVWVSLISVIWKALS